MATVTKTIGTTSRDYSTITLWEADLDNSGIYSASDDAVGECYDDSTFSESPIINGGSTINLATVTLTVASAHRHDGTPMSGCQLTGLLDVRPNENYTIEWIEVEGSSTFGIQVGTQAQGCTVQNTLVYDCVTVGIQLGGTNQHAYNNMVFHFDNAGSGTSDMFGIKANTTGTCNIYNNTVHDLTRDTSSTADSIGISSQDDADTTLRNNVVTQIDGSSGGVHNCYALSSPSNADYDYCAADDTTASGSNSLDSIATAQYVSTTAGSQDLHLKEDSDLIGVGEDKTTTANMDIDNIDRNSFVGIIWDIGAHQRRITAHIGSGGSTTVIDSAPGADGTYNGVMTNMDPDTDYSTDTDTSTGYSMDFDGTDDFIETNYTLSSGKTSIFFRFKTSTTSAIRFISNYPGWSPKDFFEVNMGITTTGKIMLNARDTSSNLHQFESTNTWNDGAWHSCLCVVDGTTATIYVDGSSDGSNSIGTFNDDMSSPSSYYVGKLRTGGSEYDGKIDDVQLFKAALSSDDASDLDSGTAISTDPEFKYTFDHGKVERDYSTITLWEADLDNTDKYDTNSEAVGQCYNDSVFDENIAVNGGTTVGLESVTLTVASGERHDGTAGTGTRMVPTTSSTYTYSQTANRKSKIEWMEIERGTQAGSQGIIGFTSGNDQHSVKNCIVHNNHTTNAGANTRGMWWGVRPIEVTNNILYDVEKDTSGTVDGRATGIYVNVGAAATYLYNNTVHDIVDPGSGVSYGIRMTSGEYKNNISTDADQCFNGTPTAESHNLSSDATAGGTGSLTSKSASNQFVSTTAGSEDLHLKTGADAIDAGTDLGTTGNAHVDIDGYDRDAGRDTWDMGAHEATETSSVNLKDKFFLFFD